MRLVAVIVCSMLGSAAVSAPAALLTLVMQGCRSTRIAAVPDSTQPSALFALLSPVQAASQKLDATAMIRFEPGQLSYVEVQQQQPAEQGPSIQLVRSASSMHGAELCVSEPGKRSEFVLHDENGNINLVVAVDEADKALTHFQPPLTVAWKLMQPNVEYTSTSNMRVMDANNPSRQRERGSGTRVMKYAGMQRIRTPAGEFEAHRLEMTFNAKFNFASYSEQTIFWMVPDIGLIAQQTSERINAALILNRTSHRTIVLAER